MILSACTNEDQVFEVNEHLDEELPTSIKEFIDDSELIVKGTFNEELETINIARDVHDPTKPAEDM